MSFGKTMSKSIQKSTSYLAQALWQPPITMRKVRRTDFGSTHNRVSSHEIDQSSKARTICTIWDFTVRSWDKDVILWKTESIRVRIRYAIALDKLVMVENTRWRRHCRGRWYRASLRRSVHNWRSSRSDIYNNTRTDQSKRIFASKNQKTLVWDYTAWTSGVTQNTLTGQDYHPFDWTMMTIIGNEIVHVVGSRFLG